MNRRSVRTIRLGLVGCGRLAEIGYLPAIALVDGVELVAVADPDQSRRDLIANRGPSGAGEAVRTFVDARSLVEGLPLDAVVIASPVGAHVDDARAAAAAGVSVLVEKPPAPDATGAHELAAISPEPWVGFNRRFDPGAQRARAAMPRNGDVDLTLKIAYRRKSWRPLSVCDDALLDLGPHLVDWATWITSSAVVAVGDAEVATDRAACTLSLTRGRARIVAECDRPYREVVEVRDATGRLRARHMAGGLVRGLGARVTRGQHPLVTTLAGQLDALVRELRGRATGEIATARDAATVMTVVDAARASAGDGGRRISLGAPLDV